MIVDKIVLDVYAGNGGNGAVSFRREKFIPRGGPDGGNGGRGGNVYIETVPDITALKQYISKREIKASHGEHGRARKQHGANAQDTVLRVPIGSTITDVEKGIVWECNEVGYRFRIARGGRGGRGNFEFRTSTTQAPRESEEGGKGQHIHIVIDMRYIADVGLVGLPSAGKSSLLNVLTQAHSKVGAYPFTTLEPHLGVCGNILIADIPGLIEGAHEGKGLGVRFLKHIEKTKVLLHCIDSSTETCEQDYRVIREELSAYNPELALKREIVLLTKSDTVSQERMNELKKMFAEHEVYSISVVNDEEIRKLHELLQNL